MKLIKISIALALAVTACAASAQNAASVQKRLTAIYNRIAVYTQKKDFETLKKMLNSGVTSDFKYATGSGQVLNRQQMLVQMEAELKTPGTITDCTNTVRSVVIHGRTAIAHVVSSFAMSIPGQDKKVHKVKASETSDDTWVQSGSGWKLKFIKSLKSEQSMDGKKLPLG